MLRRETKKPVERAGATLNNPTGGSQVAAMKPRLRKVRAAVAKARVKYPALCEPATFDELMNVVKGEDIIFVERKLSTGTHGTAADICGHAAIMLSESLVADPERRRFVLAHEIGHVLMGHIVDRPRMEKRYAEFNPRWIQREDGGWVLHTDPSPTENALEAEADLFAELICAGIQPRREV